MIRRRGIPIDVIALPEPANESVCLRDVLDDLPDPALVVDDVSGCVRAVNHAACATFGMGPGAFLAARWQDLVCPTAHAEIAGIACDARLKALVRIERLRFRKDDGTRFDAELTVRRLPRDEAARALVFVRPFTTGAAASAEPVARAQSSADRDAGLRARAAMSLATQPILVIDFDSALVIEANPAACRLFGYAPEEWTQLKGRDLHPADISDVVDQFSAWLKRRNRAFQPAIRCIRKDRTEFAARLTVTVFENLGRRQMVVTVDDVTDELCMAEEIATLEAKLEAASADATPASSRPRA